MSPKQMLDSVTRRATLVTFDLLTLPGVPAAPERPDRLLQEVERLQGGLWEPGGRILAG